MLSWNVNQGGYDRRHVFDDPHADPGAHIPEREAEIQDFLHHQRGDGVDTMALTDTYGWRARYGSDEAIAGHLGLARAAFIDLADDRITSIYGPGAGLTFATNHEAEIQPLDLDNRQGVQAILNLDGDAIQVAHIYADDLSSEVRHRQVRAGLANLEPDLPTILTGDFNELRPSLENALPGIRLRNMGFRAVVFAITLLPRQETLDTILTKIGQSHHSATIQYYRQALTELNKRTLVPELERRGYQDADPKKRPTFKKLGHLGLDYSFYNAKIQPNEFTVLATGQASDHDATRFRAQVA